MKKKNTPCHYCDVYPSSVATLDSPLLLHFTRHGEDYAVYSIGCKCYIVFVLELLRIYFCLI